MTPEERLRAFIEQNTKKLGPHCVVCSLPEEVKMAAHTLQAEGAKLSTIAAWLEAEGHGIRSWSVGNHFRQHVRRG